jgi:hypothetical protein
MLLPGLSLLGREGSVSGDDSRIERYHYEAVPIGREDETEQIRLALSFDVEGIGFVSTSVSEKTEEKIRVRMTREGYLLWGARSFSTNSGDLTEARIWRDENRVYIDQTGGDGKKTTIRDIPEASTLAVEASLFVLMRFFPYNSATRWDLFMVDFRGKSAMATARQTGAEDIVVPAGMFPCYRIEVFFHVAVLNPKAVCWVTMEQPHVVVKSIGKRGIMTPTFITSLVKKALPASMAKQ